MQIPYFAANQNVVFIPALITLLIATVLICMPIVFGQRLRRTKRMRPVAVLAGVLAVVALVGTAWLGGIGFRTLGDERARVQAQIEQRYDLRLNAGQVGELVDGGKPQVRLPDVATAAKLEHPEKLHSLQLAPRKADAHTFDLTIGGKPWPSS